MRDGPVSVDAKVPASPVGRAPAAGEPSVVLWPWPGSIQWRSPWNGYVGRRRRRWPSPQNCSSASGAPTVHNFAKARSECAVSAIVSLGWRNDEMTATGLFASWRRA
jgi:hypothetical protein